MSDTATPVRVYGVLPAAGMSRRMGRPKQTLRCGDSTLAGRVVSTMLATADAVVVVTRTELVAAMDLPEDERLLVTINDDPLSQMMDSIRMGISRLVEVFALASDPAPGAGILVIPADMPTVPVYACRMCADIFRRDPTRIIIAARSGRRGHPIVFPAGLRQTLDQIEGGLNELPMRCPDQVREVEIDDPAIFRDVNTPADYEGLGS